MDDLIKLQYQLTQDRVESALEMSRRGGHLWIFMPVPLLARKCRIYIYDLAQRLGVPVKRSGLAEGIEVFPKHDEIQQGAFGNALRGPLGMVPAIGAWSAVARAVALNMVESVILLTMCEISVENLCYSAEPQKGTAT